MAERYGYSYHKKQYRWVHPTNKNQPITVDDWVAAPATLSEFLRSWDAQGNSPSRQVRCALAFQGGQRIKLNLDTEKDYQAVIKMVLEGEEVELTVIAAMPSTRAPEVCCASSQREGTSVFPPEWFTSYMGRFREELLQEMKYIIDQKLSENHVQTPSSPPVDGNCHPIRKEMLSFVDFKRLKIDKKLQKLQNRTQKMSLDLEDTGSAYHKAKGERKLSKISKRMEQLEAKKSKISTKKCGREVALVTEMDEPMLSVPVMIEPEQVEQMQGMQTEAALLESAGPKSLFDACVLTADDSVLHVAVGSAFVKSWRIKNVGEFPWTDKTELRLSHATAGLCAVLDKVLVPILQPGEEGDVTVSFQAPAFPGLFETYWHLYNNSDRFGQWLHCSISVDLIPGEQSLECTSSMSSSTVSQHPAVMEIQKVDLSGSLIQQARKEKEAESDSDDDDDDLSSDSDESDSFVHIPMPQCYQYNLARDAAAEGASNSVMAEAGMSSSTFLASAAPCSSTGVVADCKTPPSTPMDRDSEEEAETSDTTQIKYPLLDLSELSQIPPMPALSKSASGDHVEEREQTPVHILPETLVSGAMSVAAKAFSSAEAIMRSIQSPMSSVATFSIPPSAPQPLSEVAGAAASGPASVLTDSRTQHLITLSEMGFYDSKLNLELLNMYNENLEHVIADLVIRAKKH